MDSILQTLYRLNKSDVPYVLIGGMAARIHGSSINTEDIDGCISAEEDHFRRIVAGFADVNPRYRMRPEHPLLTPDHPWLKGLRSLYLRTDLGQLDVLGEISGLGDFEAIKPRTIEVDWVSLRCRVLDIPALIETKRRVGRPKDQQAVREPEFILRQLQQPPPPA